MLLLASVFSSCEALLPDTGYHISHPTCMLDAQYVFPCILNMKKEFSLHLSERQRSSPRSCTYIFRYVYKIVFTILYGFKSPRDL